MFALLIGTFLMFAPGDLVKDITNKLTPSRIINKINGASMEKPNSKYIPSTNESDKKTMVTFGDVATCDSFDLKILEASEMLTLNFNKKTIKPKENNKFILVKFRVKNSSEYISELYFNDYILKDLTTNKFYIFGKNSEVIDELCKDNKFNDNVTNFKEIKSGIIKNAYILFQVPKSCSLDNLVLECTTAYFKLKESN